MLTYASFFGSTEQSVFPRSTASVPLILPAVSTPVPAILMRGQTVLRQVSLQPKACMWLEARADYIKGWGWSRAPSCETLSTPVAESVLQILYNFIYKIYIILYIKCTDDYNFSHLY